MESAASPCLCPGLFACQWCRPSGLDLMPLSLRRPLQQPLHRLPRLDETRPIARRRGATSYLPTSLPPLMGDSHLLVCRLCREMRRGDMGDVRLRRDPAGPTALRPPSRPTGPALTFLFRSLPRPMSSGVGKGNLRSPDACG